MHTRHGKDKLTRGEKQAATCQFPPLTEYEQFIVSLARECGMYETGWQDIRAWMQASGTQADTWTASAIRSIALAYTGAIHKYDTTKDSAPWQALQIDRAAVDKSVRAAFRGRNK